MVTGRLAYQTAPGSIDIREYDLPTPQGGGTLLQTVAAGICGSDVHIFSGEHPLKSVVIGHEILARVIDPTTRPYDTAGEPLAEGDRVSVVYFQACLRCVPCGRGEYDLCVNVYQKWMQPPDDFPHFVGTCGTHYYADPTQALFKVPADLPSLVATSANCALAQVMCGVDRAGVRAGHHVVIQGAGGLGLYATALAKERGATVTVLDAAEHRLNSAREFGADHLISLAEHPNPADRLRRVLDVTDGQGGDIGFDLTGVAEAILEGVQLLRIGGRYIEIGNVFPGSTVAFDFGDLTRRAITVQPVIRYEPWHLKEGLRFLARNLDRLPLDTMLDGVYPLDDIGTALEDSAQRKINRAAVLFEDV